MKYTMDGQTNWQNDCEKCIHAKWSYETINKHRNWYVSGCKIKSDPYDCDDYESKETER